MIKTNLDQLQNILRDIRGCDSIEESFTELEEIEELVTEPYESLYTFRIPLVTRVVRYTPCPSCFKLNEPPRATCWDCGGMVKHG